LSTAAYSIRSPLTVPFILMFPSCGLAIVESMFAL